MGPGPGLPAAAGPARRARRGGHGPGRRRTSCTPWSRARSWRSPTARPGTAIRGSPTSRSPACCPRPTQRNAGPWSAPRPPRTCGRAAPGGAAPRLPGYATGAVRVPDGMTSAEPTAEESGAAARPAWEVTGQGTPRRGPRPTRGDTCHLDVADRFGNMVSATPSGGWLQSSPVIPGLGFCLGTRAQMFTLTPGLPNTPRPGQAAADHADPEPGAARRGAVPGLRHARRGPAGPVDAGLLPAPRAVRDEPAGGDRRARLPHPALPVVVLPARIVAAGGGRGGAGRGRRCSMSCAAAGTRSRSGRPGRWAGSARWPGTGGCSTRPRTPAACRATPPAAERRPGGLGRWRAGSQTGEGQTGRARPGPRRRRRPRRRPAASRRPARSRPTGSSADPAASTSSPSPAASTGAWLRSTAAASPGPPADSARCVASR